jgi:hypothetical protein
MIAPSPAPSADARAEAIFARTRAAIVARSYPSTIAYKVRVSGSRGGTWTGRSYQSYERWPSGAVLARTISDEENAHPTKPSGVTLGFFGMSTGASGQADLLGVPKLAPTYAFGLGTPPQTEPGPGSAGGSGLRTIGSVLAQARNYAARLVGEESVDGTTCWHLRLRPLGNPGKYRLRDLWVEESSYQTIRLRTYGNFTAKETGSGLWTVAYALVGGSWYLTSEISNGPVEGADGWYAHVAVQFTGIAADPNETLDFGLSTVDDEAEITEPPQ